MRITKYYITTIQTKGNKQSTTLTKNTILNRVKQFTMTNPLYIDPIDDDLVCREDLWSITDKPEDDETHLNWEEVREPFNIHNEGSPIMTLFQRVFLPFVLFLHPRKITKDLIDTPDILSFRLCEKRYNEYVTKACQLTNTDWFGKRHDKYTDEDNKDTIVGHIEHFFNKIYHDWDILTQNPSIISYEISEPIMKYISGCFFFRAIMHPKILPYIRNDIEHRSYEESYQVCNSIRNIIKKTTESYEELYNFEYIIHHEGEHNSFPFRQIRFHYSEEFYNRKIFGCESTTATSVIPFIMKNPNLYQMRKMTNFADMIYGHPQASNGLCREMMDELDEMGAIIESH